MKQVAITADIEAKLRRVTGPDADLADYAVFETIAINSLPIPGKDGTIWEGAVHTPLTLSQIADHVQADPAGVPVIWSHDADNKPYGRLFWAETKHTPAGELEVRALFFVDPTEKRIAAKINAGSIDEVSIGMGYSQLLCSECGFDYMGDEAEFEHVFTRTCDKGHTIGTDGVHLRLIGLRRFYETSLVTRGAANGAKIVSKENQKLAGTREFALAARGFDTDQLVFTGSATGTSQPKELSMDLTAQLVDVKADLKVANGQIETLNATITAKDATIASLTEERDAAVAARDAALADGKAQAADAAVAYLKDLFKRVAVAAGETIADDQIPADVAALQAGIDERQAKLTALIPTGGRSKGAAEGADKQRAVSTRAYTGKEA